MSYTQKNWNKQTAKKSKDKPKPILLIPPTIVPTQRVHAIASHVRLDRIFDHDTINHLIQIFKNNGKITDYIRDERARRGLDDTYTTIQSSIYGTERGNTTLQVMVWKNGKEFIHLSIHVAPEFLSASEKNSGIIHIVKNVYTSRIASKKSHLIKSIYAISYPSGKSRSLRFTLKHRTMTPNLVQNVTNEEEKVVQQEMDVITTVLNQLFDEDDPIHYIGHPVQQTDPNTNTVLHNLDRRTKFIARKNKGIYNWNHSNSSIAFNELPLTNSSMDMRSTRQRSTRGTLRKPKKS